MTRLEYIVPGGLRLRFVNIPPFGRILMPPSGFYFPLLTGKTVLGVYKDGIGATKIINSDTIFSPVPTGKHVTFKPVMERFIFQMCLKEEKP